MAGKDVPAGRWIGYLELIDLQCRQKQRLSMDNVRCPSMFPVSLLLLNEYSNLGMQEPLQWPEPGWNNAEFDNCTSKP
jgi:hypothetical protein